MSAQSLSGIETTFGLNLLNSVGCQESYVFSPISWLFVFALLGNEKFNSTVFDKYSDLGFLDSEVRSYLKNDLTDISVRADSGINDVRRNSPNQTRILFNAGWEEKLHEKRSWLFYPSKYNSKVITYLIKEKHVLLNVDDAFQMISIMYENKSLQFVVLVPSKPCGLKKALKKLTKQRFEKLFQESTVQLVQIMIPKLDVLQLLINSKVLGLQPPIKTSLKYKESPRISKMLYRPENRLPYHFRADHPFVFAVLRNGHPVYFGVFS
ncbi:Serpin domain-containing protein [Caenorhabditis elegans]|uniref:Serpin domain-containing protein n=1 Tax=Caenorhabditis elegans TaxID=6239 RepID=Q18287_CAEEL|nr:Serpin domain-containing protein [Caenorhabditis elegans]CCD63329.1 Serpin domain-containing protein [Caenorhabditis elegans]|eukprot:NP_509497.2 Uncharacterized protein CELE_C28G1.2 [Caenorhabditis elegans]